MAIDLTGTWHAAYAELDGEMGPVARVSRTEITYKDGKFKIDVNGKLEHEGEYSVDDKHSPAQITYIYRKSSFFELGKPRVGIVQLVGSTLKDCIGAVGAHPPATFNTKAHSESVLTVFQRSGHERGSEAVADRLAGLENAAGPVQKPRPQPGRVIFW